MRNIYNTVSCVIDLMFYSTAQQRKEFVFISLTCFGVKRYHQLNRLRKGEENDETEND